MTLKLDRPRKDRSDHQQNVYSHEGVWSEHVSQEGRVVTDVRPIPFHLVHDYADQAARLGIVKELEDGGWYASIPSFEGVWATGEHAVDALGGLAEVVYDWAILKMLDGDTDIPVVNDIDLRST